MPTVHPIPHCRSTRLGIEPPMAFCKTRDTDVIVVASPTGMTVFHVNRPPITADWGESNHSRKDSVRGIMKSPISDPGAVALSNRNRALDISRVVENPV